MDFQDPRTWVLIGVAIAKVIGTVLAIILIYRCCKRRKRRNSISPQVQPNVSAVQPNVSEVQPNVDVVYLPNVSSREIRTEKKHE